MEGSRPLHTRTFDFTIRWSADPGAWQARAEVVDLRKGGFVPIAGDLQSAGFLHHMVIDATVDPVGGVVQSVSASQPRVAFEPSTLSRGESCRGPVESIGAVRGSDLAGFDQQLRTAISGAAGCAHLLALARLLGATLLWLSESTAAASIMDWRDGERIFHRTISYDISESGPDGLSTLLQLTDLEFTPCPEVVRPLDRLAGQSEVRGNATVTRPDLRLAAIELGLRRRDPGSLAEQDFTDVSEEIVDALGEPLTPGWRRQVLANGRVAGEPVSAALIDLTAAVLQAVASDTEAWPQRVIDNGAIVVTGGAPDSCYMWRSGGALTSALERET
jgi:hypothetical protein